MLETGNNNTYCKKVRIPELAVAKIFGEQDKHIKSIIGELSVMIAYVGGELTVTGEEDNVRKTIEILNYLLELSFERDIISEDVRSAVRMAQSGDIDGLREVSGDRIKVAGVVKYVTPKSRTQRDYFNAMRDNDMIFAYGPAGTGKTYMAVAMAVNLYLSKKINKIILTRPAVEAGEKLGFLPGDLADKINPYLRPLHDALNAMMDHESVIRLMERGVIEVAPLAFMRGRTLSNAFVILDEAQNTTMAQMKMFLTRLGFGSKAVITGDTTQIDLPHESDSGLMDAIRRLKGVEGIGFVQLSEKDVVRHPLVTRIISAYERSESKIQSSD